MEDSKVREAFITWLIHDHLEDRSVEELEERLKQAGNNIMEGEYRTIGELKEEVDNQ
jgi:hypothetical protein